MSYILDALRRADAERERDPARGIHAQPAAVVPARARTRVPAWAWAAGAVVLLAAAGLAGWQRMALRPAAPVLPVAAVAAVAPVAPVVRPAPPAVVPVATAVMPPAPPETVRTAPPMVVKAPPAAKAVAAAAPAAASAPAPAAAPEPVAAAERIYNVAELPPDVQGALPKLAITGGVHSETPSQRMLIVAGQVVHEGAELAPGVVLDQIRPRNAVLRFRGYRYSVGY